MNEKNMLTEAAQFHIIQVTEPEALLFRWKPIRGLGVDDFRTAVRQFAEQCATTKPGRALIDARALDPQSAALAWVSGQAADADGETFADWFPREIAPLYNAAGIVSVATATGDPDAGGPVGAPPGADFEMGYFSDLEAAAAWNI